MYVQADIIPLSGTDGYVPSVFFLSQPRNLDLPPASAAFLSVQGMYYSIRKFNESIKPSL